MRRILLAALALLLLAMPVHAQEAAEPDVTFGAENLEQALDEQTREALSGTSPTSAGDFGKELWHIVSSAISGAGLALRPALVSAGKVLAAAMLCAFASGAQETDAMKLPAQLAGAFAITALCTRDVSSMIGLARETVTKLSDFTALLLPVLSSSLAASGGSVSAGTLLAGGSFAMSLLTKLASGVLIPLVYVYILLSAAECATDGGGLGKIPRARRTGNYASHQGALRRLYGVPVSQPRADRLGGRVRAQGGAGGLFRDGACCGLDAV